eukprot:4861875-Alexandrium_andersonii.AAC.1
MSPSCAHLACDPCVISVCHSQGSVRSPAALRGFLRGSARCEVQLAARAHSAIARRRGGCRVLGAGAPPSAAAAALPRGLVRRVLLLVGEPDPLGHVQHGPLLGQVPVQAIANGSGPAGVALACRRLRRRRPPLAYRAVRVHRVLQDPLAAGADRPHARQLAGIAAVRGPARALARKGFAALEAARRRVWAPHALELDEVGRPQV